MVELVDALAATSGAYNFNPAYLPKWRKALAQVRAGTGRAKVAMVGDSTTAGWGAGTGANGTDGARVKSAPYRLAEILARRGLNAKSNSFWGDANLGYTPYQAYDPRVVIGASWSRGGATTVAPGGWLLRANTGVTTTTSFTPSDEVDTFDIYYVVNTGNGTFTANIDGGATLATVDTSVGTPGIYKTTITATKGAHTVNVQRTAGGAFYVVGIDAYDSTARDVAIWNLGAASWASADWAVSTNAWNPAPGLTGIAPDLTLINLGINDWKDTPVSVSTYTTNLQTLITAAKAAGDVVLVAPFPSSTARASVAQQAPFIDAIVSLGETNSCPVLSLTHRFTSWADANTVGYTYDALHPNALGYADVAQALAPLLLDA